jgi:hypothetical protein
MATKKRVRGNPLPLIIEEHPEDYDGYPFITLIEYRDNHLLGIIDNATDKMIKAYVLDLCGPAGVDEENIINVASVWYENSRDRYPISFEFSKMNLSEEVKPIYKSFPVGFVTRIIGPMAKFEMNEVKSIKRRRKKPLPANIEVHKKVIKL